MSGLILPKRLAGAPRPSITVPTLDPEQERKAVWDAVGDISGVNVFGNRLLIAKWVPETIGSLIASEETKKENQYQCKIGMVLKMGHSAFKTDRNYDFGPDAIEVGDWVTFYYNDGTELEIRRPGTLNNVLCKILKDTDISMKIARPDLVY